MRPVIRWIGDMGYTTNIEPIIIVQVDRFVIKTWAAYLSITSIFSVRRRFSAKSENAEPCGHVRREERCEMPWHCRWPQKLPLVFVVRNSEWDHIPTTSRIIDSFFLGHTELVRYGQTVNRVGFNQNGGFTGRGQHRDRRTEIWGCVKGVTIVTARTLSWVARGEGDRAGGTLKGGRRCEWEVSV